jgi:hypothetical protein
VVNRVALLAALAACGPRVEGPSLAGVVAARADAAPVISNVDRTRECIVEGPGDAGGFERYPVFSAADGGAPIAIVNAPAEVPLRFLDWPAAGRGGRAKVQLAGNGAVRLAGFVDLADRRFQLGARVDIDPPHVFAVVGTQVRVHGRREGGLEVAIDTPFTEPASITVTVPCRAAVYQRASLALSRRSAQPLPILLPKHDRLTFFTEPGGRALFHAQVSPGRTPLSLLERRAAFAHVLVGDAPVDQARGTVVVDAWVPVEDVLLAEPSNDRDSHGSIPDKTDRCPSQPHPVQDTPLRLGSADGPVIGVVEKGAALVIVERRGGFASIRFLDELVAPPPESAFFVASAAISGDCDRPLAEDDEDGCPCDTL